MGNIMDYISWRGDLSFEQSQFNEVDNLILACFSYVNLDGISAVTKQKGIGLKKLTKEFMKLHTMKELEADKSFIRLAPFMMMEMAKSVRFGKCVVRNYVNDIVTEAEQQFAAMEIVLEDGTSYVSFRGTDDTIIGWKEDFNLSTGVVPAQKRAIEYLQKISEHTDGMLRVGGHSKGGNLAVYAACNSSEKIINRIIEIYNNDGPGFNQEILEIPEYQKIAKKIKKFVPEGCVFGIMLEYLEEMIVVKSDAKGLMQHSGFTWQIEGTHFVESKAINAESQAMDTAFKSWLVKVDEETRKNAVECLFSIIEAAGIKKINDFSEKTFTHLIVALKELKNMDSESRNALIQFFKVLLVENNNSRKEYKKNKS